MEKNQSKNNPAAPEQDRYAVVIDDDLSMCDIIKSSLDEVGVANVQMFSDIGEAWKYLSSASEPKCDYIFLDWKMPQIPGPAFFNRLRQHQSYRIKPIFIISGYLTHNDDQLFNEFPFTIALEKPTTTKIIQSTLNVMDEDYKWFEGQEETINRVFGDIIQKASDQTVKELKKIVATSPKPIPMYLWAARLLTENNLIEEAEDLLSEFLMKFPDSFLAFNELGKILLRQGRFPEAETLLQQAQKFSPKNLERICLLGEVNLNLCKFEEAQAHFKKALHIDQESEAAQEGVAVAKSAADMIRQQGTQVIAKSFLSFLNSSGIYLVRTGKFEEGLEQYKAAFRYAYNPVFQAKLAFNIGLGNLRSKRLAEAIKWLEIAVSNSKGTYQKASDLLTSIKNRISQTPQTDLVEDHDFESEFSVIDPEEKK